MSDNTGLIFVGQIDGKSVKAAVYFNGDPVSIDGPLWFTLDQWHKLRSISEEDDGEHPIWATTPAEYEQTTGEAISA